MNPAEDLQILRRFFYSTFSRADSANRKACRLGEISRNLLK
jgi:hypothetical protein